MSKIRGNDCADERDSQQASVGRHGFCPRQALARRLVTRRGGARGVPCVPHVFFTGRISIGLLRLHCRCGGAPHTAELSTTEYDSRPLEGTAGGRGRRCAASPTIVKRTIPGARGARPRAPSETRRDRTSPSRSGRYRSGCHRTRPRRPTSPRIRCGSKARARPGPAERVP